MFGFAARRIQIADKWWVTIAVTLGMFMSLMDSTIVNVMIPQMQKAFEADIAQTQWIVTIYMLTQAAVIPTAPYLTARFGSKRTYVGTLTAFLLGSVLCGFAWNLPALLVFRLIQGIGGGILLPLVMTLLYQAFPPEERGKAASAMGIPLMVAPAFGPVLGGYLVSTFGWQWAFFINVPLGIVAVIIAQKVLRQTPPGVRPHFDAAGFLTVAAGSAMLLYAVSNIASGGNSLQNGLILIGSLASLSAFVLIEMSKTRHGQTPLLNLRRFTDRTFTLSNVANVCIFIARFGVIFLFPIYLQTVRGQTPFQSGLLQVAQALATVLVLVIAGRLVSRLGARLLAIMGVSLFAGGTALMLTLALDTPIWWIVGILILLGCSNGLVQQIPVAAMAGIAKEEHNEVANGSTLVSVLQATAAPIGVALLSGLVEAQSRQNRISLAAQGVSDAILDRQSTVLAMHASFLVASIFGLLALAALLFVPKGFLRQISFALRRKPAMVVDANLEEIFANSSSSQR